MNDNNEQKIEPGQVWRRNSDGVVVEIRYSVSSRHERSWQWRSGDRTGRCNEPNFRTRYTFVRSGDQA